jgi:hypothetical protein
VSTALDRDKAVAGTISLRPEEGVVLGPWAQQAESG